MTELKTLKELTKPFCATEWGCAEGAAIDNPAANREALEIMRRSGLPFDYLASLRGSASGEVVRLILRSEAIRWVKKIQKIVNHEITALEETKEVVEAVKSTGAYSSSAVHWIMYFFNITEDELK